MATKFLYEMFLTEWEPKVIPGGGDGSGRPAGRLAPVRNGGATGPEIVALANEKGWELGENAGWLSIKGSSGAVYFPKMKSGRVPYIDIRYGNLSHPGQKRIANPSMDDVVDAVHSVLHIPED